MFRPDTIRLASYAQQSLITPRSVLICAITRQIAVYVGSPDPRILQFALNSITPVILVVYLGCQLTVLTILDFIKFVYATFIVGGLQNYVVLLIVVINCFVHFAQLSYKWYSRSVITCMVGRCQHHGEPVNEV